MQNKDALDMLLEEFEPPTGDKEPRKGITFWPGTTVHSMYHELQEKTGKAFGKWAEELLVEAIKRKHAKLIKSA